MINFFGLDSLVPTLLLVVSLANINLQTNMETSHFYAVIMAGGSGTRLWPLSRKNKPKQLHALMNDKALIRETFERLVGNCQDTEGSFLPENVIISTVPDFVDDIKKLIPEIPAENYIVEPSLRGNAAACGLVTAVLNKRNPNAILFFVPADQTIEDEKGFTGIIKFAKKTIKQHPKKILTIGIKPKKADTGLGYIEMGGKEAENGDYKAYNVSRFAEKPDLATAEEYIKSGQYLWNAGMFMWQSDFMLSLFEKHLPQIFEPLQNIASAVGSKEESAVLENEYAKMEKTSIDFGIMEKTKEILVIPANFGWSDVGTWSSLHDSLSLKHGKNVIARGNHVGLDDENVLVFGGKKLITTVGLKDIAIIETADTILICNTNESHKVKELLDKLDNKYL